MGSDKIFMFDNPAAGESAGIMSMIPALLQNKGLDPNMIFVRLYQTEVPEYRRTGSILLPFVHLHPICLRHGQYIVVSYSRFRRELLPASSCHCFLGH